MMNDTTASESLELFWEAIRETQPDLAANLQGRDLHADTRLADLGISSIALYEIAGYLEEQLDANLPEDQLLNLQTLGDVSHMIARVAA